MNRILSSLFIVLISIAAIACTKGNSTKPEINNAKTSTGFSVNETGIEPIAVKALPPTEEINSKVAVKKKRKR